jgi:hypothetical protein
MVEAGGSRATAVPATLEAVTPDWLSDVLDAPVTDVRCEPIGGSVGFLGLLARLHLSYDDASAGPASVIAKLPSDDPAARALADIYRFYEREGAFYRHLAGAPAGCGVRVPVCFGAVGEGNDVALVLEDLGGLRVGDQVAGATIDDAERALRTAADLHAAWWDNPALDTLDWMPAGNDAVYKMAATNYPLAWPFFVDGFGDLLTAEQRSIGERLIDRVGDLIEENARPPWTVNHGDFRLDNLFFDDHADHADDGAPAGPCTVIDWQIASRSRTGCLDVAYFLSGNVEPALLADDFERLLRTYHDRLGERGVTGFSFADLEQTMRLASLSCLAYPVLGATVLAREDDRAVALFTRMIQGYFGLAVQLDAGSVLSS